MMQARKIKSPQLYRLSYRPCRGFVSFGSSIVSAVYTPPFATGCPYYHVPVSA